MPVPKVDMSPMKKRELENARRSRSTEFEILKGEKELAEESDEQGGSSGSSGDEINQSAIESTNKFKTRSNPVPIRPTNQYMPEKTIVAQVSNLDSRHKFYK